MNRLQSALDFISTISAEPDLDRMLVRLREVAGEFGFDSFLLASVPDPGRPIDGHLMLSGWDVDWLERYVHEDYIQIDPVARHLRTAVDPFAWSEAIGNRPLSAAARRIMDEAASIGMRDGFCIPLWDLDGQRSVLSLATERVELSQGERGVLHLIGMYAQNRARELLGRPPAPRAVSLSPRERECLQWTAAGKTSWEISTILDLSRNTTEDYIAQATRKLGASNRTQAVAEGIRRGLIL